MFDKQMVEIVQQIDEAAKRCFEWVYWKQ
jgi:hypothetical protein